MPDSNRQRNQRQIEALRTRLDQADGLASADLLPAQRVGTASLQGGIDWRHEVYTPLVTLRAFLAQVISPEACCRGGVARVFAWLIGPGRRPCRPTTGAYCKARARLGERLPRRLAREIGSGLHRQARPAWLWNGRRVEVVGGTNLSMPDTKANQKQYPQPSVQKPGLGFPIARAVAVFCLATGAVIDATPARCSGKRTGESAPLRQLIGGLEAGDVMLAGRGFGSSYELALWPSRGVDAVVRLHQARRADFRTGKRLGSVW